MADPTAPPSLPGQIRAERTHLAIPSLPSWIEPTIEFLRQRAVLAGVCSETRSGKLMIALHEALTNAVVHGNLGISSALKEQAMDAFAEALAQRAADPVLCAREVDIVIDYDGAACQWIITDQGAGFDVDKVLARCTSDDPDLLLSSGRGIRMMKSFLDDVRYELNGRRVVLRLWRGSAQEKRRDSRVPLAAPFKVTPVGPDGAPAWSQTYDALSRDLSESGVALLQRQLAHAGTVLIGIQTEQGIVHVPAEVKHARPIGASGMELGCQFQEIGASPPAAAPDSPQIEEVHAAILRMLEEQADKESPAKERRAHPRIVFSERIAVLVDGRAEPLVGFARDLSQGGIAFIAQEPLADPVTIVLTARPDGESVRIRSRVVRCSLIEDGFYDIAATFERLQAESA